MSPDDRPLLPGPRLVLGRVPLPLSWRLAGFYGAMFFGIGVFTPYWPVWLGAVGLDADQIGLMLALATSAKVIGSPLFAHVADRLGARRRLMLALSVAALAAFAYYAAQRSPLALGLGAVMVGLTYPALMPLGENTTLLATRIAGLDYGRVRLWGSLSFIAASWAGGALLAARGEIVVPWLVIGAAALLVVACLAMPDVRVAPSRRGWAVRGLIGDRRFLLFIATAGLIQCSHAAYYGFATLHWRGAGISETIIGLLWAEGVVAEIVLFLFAGRVVARLGTAPLFMLGAAAGLVRWTVTGLSTDLAVLVLVQALHAGTFGATHLAAMHFIQRDVPEAVSATAQGLYSALAMGVMLAFAMSGAGALYQSLGAGAFHAMTAMCLGGLAGAWLLARRAPG